MLTSPDIPVLKFTEKHSLVNEKGTLKVLWSSGFALSLEKQG